MKGRVQLVAALLMLWTFSVAAHAEQGNQPAPYRLTLQEAIQKGLQANLSVLLSGARVDGAAGTRIRRLSAALLPRVNAQTYANYQNRNLRAFGFSLPGIPDVIGPFSNYDIRLYAQQNLIDLHSLNLLRASTHDVEADKMDDRDARDLICLLYTSPSPRDLSTSRMPSSA